MSTVADTKMHLLEKPFLFPEVDDVLTFLRPNEISQSLEFSGRATISALSADVEVEVAGSAELSLSGSSGRGAGVWDR